MKLRDRKLYVNFRYNEDPVVRAEALTGKLVANSIESLLKDGLELEQAMQDSYIQRELWDVMSEAGVIEFLIRCWSLGPEFASILWRMRDRRQRQRGRQVEIDMT